MSLKGDYVLREKKKSAHYIFAIFAAVLFFSLIYFPFFAPNLRFSTGTLLARAISMTGQILITFGTIFMVWGFATLICTNRKYTAMKVAIFGFIVLWIGMYLAGGFTAVGFTNKDAPPVHKGYY